VNDAGLRFWLDHVAAEGGLWEPAGDSTLVVLPAELASRYRLAEEVTVTHDPDIAREDGVTFLGAGHPVLTQAAESVLDHGDVGYLAVQAPPQAAPTAEDLQDRIRAQLPIAHGRIDVTGTPSPVTHWLLRIGALVTYTVSADNQFQEQTETWIDVPARRNVPDVVVDRLTRLPAIEPPTEALDGAGVAAALAEAHRQIDSSAERRRADLARQLGDAHDRERQRAVAYYSDVLQGIERRISTAPDDRRDLLQARLSATLQEQERRLQEIADKYQPAHEIRPYRLHVIGVPALRVPVDVRRGERRYALELDWLIPARMFSEPRCPACASAAPLVAGKQTLGCLICLQPKTPTSPPSAPPKPRNEPLLSTRTSTRNERPAPPAKASPPQPPTTRQPAPRPAAPPPVRSRSAAPAMGGKLAAMVWDAVATRHSRETGNLLAPDSPAASLHRIFGAGALRHAVGIPGDARLEQFTSSSTVHDENRGLTTGTVMTNTGEYPYVLHWIVQGRAAAVAEMLTYPLYPDGRINHMYWWTAGRRHHPLHEPTATGLDPVTSTIVRAGGAWHGLAVAARAVTAWWRIMGQYDQQSIATPGAPAAAVHRLVAARAGDRGLFKDAAARYQVDEASVRQADAGIRRLLGLGPDRLW
jgi:hypothetical protein